jgi:hypothetical protein
MSFSNHLSMEERCMVSGCTEVMPEGWPPGWSILTVHVKDSFQDINQRTGALCPRHAYGLGSLLGGKTMVVPRRCRDPARAAMTTSLDA